jgi:hypothetical protein
MYISSVSFLVPCGINSLFFENRTHTHKNDFDKKPRKSFRKIMPFLYATKTIRRDREKPHVAHKTIVELNATLYTRRPNKLYTNEG